MMFDPAATMSRLLRDDKRYALEAYLFVFESLNYAQDVLGMGNECPSDPVELAEEAEQSAEPEAAQRHVTGQELCQAIREYALRQFGYMARTVLGNWGVHSTGDIGEIVFNLIRIGRMRKTPQDRREDFDDVYDFETAFCREFRIELPD